MRCVDRRLLILLLLAATAVVAGCGRDRIVTRPVPVERVRLVVEPVADALTEPRPIATGPLSECPRVAAERRTELETANAQLAAIRARHGQHQP